MGRNTAFAAVVVLALAVGTSLAQSHSTVADADHDGLSDEMEQALLKQFQPTFMISAQDCDLAPAEFVPAVARPMVLRRNGTIYAQAFRSARSTTQADVIELHYYHLWGSDCGRMAHPLDAEHVSALVERRSMSSASASWRATYWYAAAHQETVCNSSSGARAVNLAAEEHGPVVWISSGKHASFFSIEECRSGCGGDRCIEMKELAVAALINLGEPDAPMQQAAWIASPEWPLAGKMRPDFDAAMIAAIDSSRGEIALVGGHPSTQSVISAGNAAFSGVGVGQQHTSNALGVGGRHTFNSLKIALRNVKKALTKDSSTPKVN